MFTCTPDDLDMHVVYDVSHNIAKASAAPKASLVAVFETTCLRRLKSTSLTAACARCLFTGRSVAPRGCSSCARLTCNACTLLFPHAAGLDARVPSASPSHSGGLPVHGTAGDDWWHNGAPGYRAARSRVSFSLRSQGTCSYVLTGTEKGMQETFGRCEFRMRRASACTDHSLAYAAHATALAERAAETTRGISLSTRCASRCSWLPEANKRARPRECCRRCLMR